MKSISGKTGHIFSLSISPQNIDSYIKECTHCAHTCRICADACAVNPGKFSEIIDVCLECAKTCESLVRELVLQKQGVRNIRKVQIEACIVTCRLCARRCVERVSDFECVLVCAQAARRCADVVSVLLPKFSSSNGKGFFSFLRSNKGK